MNLSDVLDQVELPPTRVAETAWDDARRRVVRRRQLAPGGAAALAVACVVGVVAVTVGHDDTSPSPAPAPTHSMEPRQAPVVQRLVTGGRWRALLVDFPLDRIGDPTRTVPLSTDPPGRAVLAMEAPDDETGTVVLGEDGRWRRVDVPGLVPIHNGIYIRRTLRPTSLSPDATKLALPQPNALVVVDLADGSFHRYRVPGPMNEYPIWADAEHVLVVQETHPHGVLVDLRDGSVTPTKLGPSTAFAEGTTLRWRQGLHRSVMRWGDGRRVGTIANNAGGFFPQPPLVRDDVVVGVEGVYTGGAELPFETTGVVAVDGSSGRVLAYLPLGRSKATPALLLGWDGDQPIVGLPFLHEAAGLYVFAWDWRQGELHPIASVGDWTSWGTGRLP